MSPYRKAATIGALLFFCAGRAGTASEPVMTEGRVTDRHFGTPVAHARVRIRDSSGTALTLESDRQGRYHAIGLAPGIVEIVVQSAGYADASQRCRVRDGEALRLDFTLVHGGSLVVLSSRPRCEIEPETSDRYVIE
jgi:hypothetical protein